MNYTDLRVYCKPSSRTKSLKKMETNYIDSTIIACNTNRCCGLTYLLSLGACEDGVYSVAFPINIPQRQTHTRTYIREATSVCVCELRTRMEYSYVHSPFHRPQWNCLHSSEHQDASAQWTWILQFDWTRMASALLAAVTMDILLLECDSVYLVER